MKSLGLIKSEDFSKRLPKYELCFPKKAGASWNTSQIGQRQKNFLRYECSFRGVVVWHAKTLCNTA